MLNTIKTSIIILSAIFVPICICASAPIGVSNEMLQHYEYHEGNPTFHCLDNSARIPYGYVNDEYCDCADGSDEPGTSACSNGKFHCLNVGYTPRNISSNQVNDGVCDCCDGSDEYTKNDKCSNNCRELHQLAQKNAVRMKKEQEESFNLKLTYSKKGKEVIQQKQLLVSTLKNKLNEAKIQRAKADVEKSTAELSEKVAIDEYDNVKGNEMYSNALDAFKQLDFNKDNTLEHSELMMNSVFDLDKNGLVSKEEATSYLNGVTEASVDHFVTNIWPLISDLFTSLNKQRKHVSDQQNSSKKLQLKENKKKLAQVADQARMLFKSSNEAVEGLEKKISKLTKFLELDFGLDKEYYPLKINCFKLEDSEYIYKLCPFSKATQQPKRGGGATLLGTWRSWGGPDRDRYSRMIYDNGLACWNAPDRSAEVRRELLVS